jgi:hypothetical protein
VEGHHYGLFSGSVPTLLGETEESYENKWNKTNQRNFFDVLYI